MLQIAKAREIRGWTQEQLAQAVGTTQQTIQRWETGQVDPKVSRIEDISRALGIAVSFILGVDAESTDLSKEEQELVRIMRDITPQGQQQLLIYARGIAASYPKNYQLRENQTA